MIRLPRSRYKLLLCFSLLLTLGCNSGRVPTYPVKGRVMFEGGAPVRAGHIEFYNSDHDLTATGSIDKNGNFEMGTFKEGDGAVEGKHDVIITQLIMHGQMGLERVDHGGHVAPEYADYSTSGLTWTVERGSKESPEFVIRAKK